MVVRHMVQRGIAATPLDDENVINFNRVLPTGIDPAPGSGPVR